MTEWKGWVPDVFWKEKQKEKGISRLYEHREHSLVGSSVFSNIGFSRICLSVTITINNTFSTYLKKTLTQDSFSL